MYFRDNLLIQTIQNINNTTINLISLQLPLRLISAAMSSIISRVPKNQAAKRALKNRAPKLVENEKQLLVLKGAKTSAVIVSVLKDLVGSRLQMFRQALATPLRRLCQTRVPWRRTRTTRRAVGPATTRFPLASQQHVVAHTLVCYTHTLFTHHTTHVLSTSSRRSPFHRRRRRLRHPAAQQTLAHRR
jgi:hypothetical protein